MGTSKSPDGPPGSNPLLPPDAPPAPPLPDEEEDTDASPDQPAPDGSDDDTAPDDVPAAPDGDNDYSWQAAKREAGRFARSGSSSGGGGGSPAGVARAHVRAQGGAGRATANARAGRSTLASFGGFLSAVARDGAAAAAVRFGIQFVGRTVNSLLNELARTLTFAGALLDEAVARTALLETLHEVFEDCDVEADGLDALNALTGDRVEAAMEGYVANYVNAQLLHYLASRPIEDKASGSAEAYRLECQLKEFVRGLVKLEFRGIDVLAVDWQGTEGQGIVGGLFERAFTLISE